MFVSGVQEPEKPVIMAGMGTGLAPWRAVTQDRPTWEPQGLVVCIVAEGWPDGQNTQALCTLHVRTDVVNWCGGRYSSSEQVSGKSSVWRPTHFPGPLVHFYLCFQETKILPNF